MRNLSGGLIVLVCACVLGACGTIPDVKPFADATSTMRVAVGESYGSATALTREMLDRLENAPSDLSEDEQEILQRTRENYAASLRDITEALSTREKLLSAISAYADGLAAIADSGKQGEAAAKAISGEVQTLATVFMANPLPAVGIEAGEFLLSEAIKIGSLHSMGRAIEAATPLAARATEMLRKDLEDFGDLLTTREQALHASIEVWALDELNMRRVALREREYLQVRLSAALSGAPALSDRAEAARQVIDQYRADLDDEVLAAFITLIQEAKRTDLTLSEDLERVEALIASYDEWYLPLQEEHEEAERRIEKAKELLRRSQALLEAWDAAHADLGTAVRESRQVNVRALVESAVRVRNIIEKED